MSFISIRQAVITMVVTAAAVQAGPNPFVCCGSQANCPEHCNRVRFPNIAGEKLFTMDSVLLLRVKSRQAVEPPSGGFVKDGTCASANIGISWAMRTFFTGCILKITT